MLSPWMPVSFPLIIAFSISFFIFFFNNTKLFGQTCLKFLYFYFKMFLKKQTFIVPCCSFLQQRKLKDYSM